MEKTYTKQEVIELLKPFPESYWIDGEIVRLTGLSDDSSCVNSLSFPTTRSELERTLLSSVLEKLVWVTPVLSKTEPAPKTEEQDIVTATILERGKVYGDPFLSHKNIGKTWTALLNQHYGIELEHDVPASLVAQMMVAFKMQRSAKVYKDDNYIDAHAYTKFADEFQKKEQGV